jgi:Flp pilus assembly pilin Flp
MGKTRMSGQGLVEYSLVILLIALACVGALTAFGGSLDGFFASVSI